MTVCVVISNDLYEWWLNSLLHHFSIPSHLLLTLPPLPRRTLYWKAARAMCKIKTSVSYIVPVDDDVIEEARMARLQMAGEELSCRRYIHTRIVQHVLTTV